MLFKLVIMDKKKINNVKKNDHVCNYLYFFSQNGKIGTFHFGKAKVIWEPLLIKWTKLKHTQLIEGVWECGSGCFSNNFSCRKACQ